MEIFDYYYKVDAWGNGSGHGSTYEFNKDVYIPRIREFILNNQIKNVVDIGCGDCQSTFHIYNGLEIDYLGIDIVESVIESNKVKYPEYKFGRLNISEEVDEIPDAELYIIKDVLQHWDTLTVVNFLDKLVTKKFKFIIIVNDGNISNYIGPSDIKIGEWRPLSVFNYPLNRYSGFVLFKYNIKEVSLIVSN